MKVSRILLFTVLWLMIATVSALPDSKTELILASNHSPPGVIFKEAKATGYQIAMAEAIAKHMGLTLRVVQCPWLRCISLGREGAIDLLGEIDNRVERKDIVRLLSPAYRLYTTESIYARKDAGLSVKSYRDLQGLSIGVSRGYSYSPQFDHDSSLNKVVTQGEEQLIKMLIGKRFDIFIADQALGDYMLSHSKYKHQIVRLEYTILSQQASYFGLSKQSPLMSRWDELQQAYQKVLADAEIRAILGRYLGEELVPVASLELIRKHDNDEVYQ